MINSCPRCGSVQLELRPGLAENGWSCIKGGIFVLLVNFVLPMAVVFQYVSVIAMIMMGLFLIGGIFWFCWFVQRIVRQQPATLDWKCKACNKEFETQA